MLQKPSIIAISEAGSPILHHRQQLPGRARSHEPVAGEVFGGFVDGGVADGVQRGLLLRRAAYTFGPGEILNGFHAAGFHPLPRDQGIGGNAQLIHGLAADA